MMKPGGTTRRNNAGARSSTPTWTPAAPAASATSARSFTTSGTSGTHRLDAARDLDERSRALLLQAQLDHRRTAEHRRGRSQGQAARPVAERIRDRDQPHARRVESAHRVLRRCPSLASATTAGVAEPDGRTAVASQRGDGSHARRALRTATLCAAKFVVNSWWPSGCATKYGYGTLAGFSAASIVGLPGDAIGPGGRPVCLYVLYGDSTLEILVEHARDVLAERVLHRRIGLQQHARLEPVLVHRRDHRPLLGDARLLLDDRRQRHDVVCGSSRGA